MSDLTDSTPAAENAASQAADTPADTGAPEKASEPQDERAAMSEAYDKIVAKLDAEEADAAADPTEKPAKTTPPKGPDGKFQSTKPKDETAAKATEDQQPTQAPVEPAKPVIDAPVSWSAEMKQKFGTLPPDVQEYVAHRDKETAQVLSRLGNTSKQAEPFFKVAEQHWDYLKSKGLDHPAAAFDRLVQFQRFMDQNPEAAIRRLAEGYGVSLGGPEGAERTAPDPQVSRLQQQLEDANAQIMKLRSTFEAEQQRTVDFQQQQVLNTIDEFARDKSDWNDVAADVVEMAMLARQQNPNATIKTLLQQAYDRAVWANPKSREARIKAEAERALKERQKKATDARGAAAFNVSSAPVPAGQFQSERDYLGHIYDQAMAN